MKNALLIIVLAVAGYFLLKKKPATATPVLSAFNSDPNAGVYSGSMLNLSAISGPTSPSSSTTDKTVSTVDSGTSSPTSSSSTSSSPSSSTTTISSGGTLVKPSLAFTWNENKKSAFL